MGRADTAGCEHIIIASTKGVQSPDDVVLIIGNDADLLQIYRRKRKKFSEMADVLVLGSSGQEFISDGQDGGRDNCLLGHDLHRKGMGLFIVEPSLSIIVKQSVVRLGSGRAPASC